MTEVNQQNGPLVSILVTTLNNHATLDACLRSIRAQSYANIELIVVDNNSTDDTKTIAHWYTDRVYNKGPERSTQRNFGVHVARGDYVVIIDSDMELDRGVIAACVQRVQHEPEIKGVIIPEESFGIGFWAQCKRLERSFYVGVDWIEAARFFEKVTYEELGGYDESMVSGEDWDLSQRVAQIAKIGRVHEYIRHNEGNIKLLKTLRKKSYYAQKFTSYTDKNLAGDSMDPLERNVDAAPSRSPYAIVLKRFGLFFAHPFKLFRNPALGFGVLFMKVCEFGFGAVGYLRAGKETAE